MSDEPFLRARLRYPLEVFASVRADNERLRSEVERLRQANEKRIVGILGEAGEQIERLRAENERLLAENERLRAAMNEVADDCESEEPMSYKKIAFAIRNALKESGR